MARARSPYKDSAASGASSQTPTFECLQKDETVDDSATPLPPTSIERLTLNLEQPDHTHPASIDSTTVLYLAYGSNLCNETFRGMRGIRPLSKINVSVPTLRFTLSLPGLPFQEPCFANVDWRKLPEKPKVPDMPKVPPFNPPQSSQEEDWDGGLIGVVYEVTREDWRQIVRTESGGTMYKEVVVPCIPLPEVSTPEKPRPTLPRPVLARTLFAPRIPAGDPDDPYKGSFWKRLFGGPYRPDPDYAQASARYLKLITDGARENNLPDAYQEYLQSLQPYTITTTRQQIGRILLLGTCAPFMLPLMFIARITADKDGKYPPVLATATTFSFAWVWVLYDHIIKPVFGDGERTEGGDQSRKSVKNRRLSLGHPTVDEEMPALIEDQITSHV